MSDFERHIASAPFNSQDIHDSEHMHDLVRHSIDDSYSSVAKLDLSAARKFRMDRIAQNFAYFIGPINKLVDRSVDNS